MKPFFNYKTDKTKPHTDAEKKIRQNNRFLDENYNFNLFLDQKDGGSGIDKALNTKHHIKGSYQSKKATKQMRLQNIP